MTYSEVEKQVRFAVDCWVEIYNFKHERVDWYELSKDYTKQTFQN